MNKEIAERRQIDQLQQALDEKTAQLEATSKELERFTYSVSHDLRAPLRAIEGFSKILLEDYAGKLDEEADRYLKIIDTSSQKLTRLLDDLLLLSRMGRHEMKIAQLNMRELVGSICDELKDEAAPRKMDFKINALPDGSGDAILLRQIWTNLISNAIKFTALEKSALIEVSGKIEDDKIIYSVKDNGVGFDMKSATRLFGVFQRLHSEEEFAGSGIGLALVQRLVRRHGGDVWAEAKPGEGAEFFFTLPRIENNRNGG